VPFLFELFCLHGQRQSNGPEKNQARETAVFINSDYRFVKLTNLIQIQITEISYYQSGYEES
jgi:hypothetical protein